METLMETILEYFSLYGIKAIMALLIFFVGKWAANQLANLSSKVMTRQAMDPALVNFLHSLIYWTLFAFVVIAALSNLGIQTASFVALIGAAGLAIGLALQGSLSNFAAGILILLFRPFKSKDYVEIAGTAGMIENIQIFTTQLLTADNKLIIIPNSSVTSGNIINYSAKPTRRVDMVIGISYGDDIDKARQLILDEIAKESRILKDPAPQVAISALADSSVNFVVRPWVNTADYWDVNFALTEAIKKRFDQEGITIPFPQRYVHMITSKT